MTTMDGRIAEKVREVTNRLYGRGMNSSFSGNVSARIGKNAILITPGGVDKYILSTEQLSAIDLEGCQMNGNRPSSEYKMHTFIYKAMPEVNAIVHAHPKFSLPLVKAHGLAGLKKALLDTEAADYYVGSVGEVDKLPTGSTALAEAVAMQVKNGKMVVVMKGHGTVGIDVGESEAALSKSLGRLEELEDAAERWMLYLNLLRGEDTAR